jgi:Ca-activated chloride channel family protein
MKVRPAIFLCAALLPLLGETAMGQTAASRNTEGNRLFAEGKFGEAERQYLEAQADLPQSPELFYNLGNALVRQKKYDMGLQALNQAAREGDRRLRADSWFNAGDALFEMGNFAEAAQAFAHALRINPGDRDAKHNLELALQKSEEQQKRPEQSAEQDPQERQSGRNPPGQPESRPGPEDNQKKSQPANPKPGQAEQQEGGLTRERALQILDAMQNQEMLEQRRQLERLVRRKATGKDW